jgi:hypothetical protein
MLEKWNAGMMGEKRQDMSQTRYSILPVFHLCPVMASNTPRQLTI